MAPVAVADPDAALERDSVLVGGVQVVLRVQIDLLAGTQSFDGVCVEQYQTVRIGMAPFDAGTGDVVGLRRQAVMLEKLPTRPYDARIVDIDVLHEKPCPHAVVLQRASELPEPFGVPVEQRFGLPGRISVERGAVSGPDMAVAVVVGRDSAFERRDLSVGERKQVDPQGDLAAVQRGLLHDGSRTGGIGLLARAERVDLIGRVAQKVALENGTEFSAVARQQVEIGGTDVAELLGQRSFRVGDMQYGMALAHAAWTVEISYLDAYVTIKQYFA